MFSRVFNIFSKDDILIKLICYIAYVFHPTFGQFNADVVLNSFSVFLILFQSIDSYKIAAYKTKYTKKITLSHLIASVNHKTCFITLNRIKVHTFPHVKTIQLSANFRWILTTTPSNMQYQLF